MLAFHRPTGVFVRFVAFSATKSWGGPFGPKVCSHHFRSRSTLWRWISSLMVSPKAAMNSPCCTFIALHSESGPKPIFVRWQTASASANSPIPVDSSTGKMFGCWPRHQVRILVPERGEPTIKIGLFIVSCISFSLVRFAYVLLPKTDKFYTKRLRLVTQTRGWLQYRR